MGNVECGVTTASIEKCGAEIFEVGGECFIRLDSLPSVLLVTLHLNRCDHMQCIPPPVPMPCPSVAKRKHTHHAPRDETSRIASGLGPCRYFLPINSYVSSLWTRLHWCNCEEEYMSLTYPSSPLPSLLSACPAFPVNHLIHVASFSTHFAKKKPGA